MTQVLKRTWNSISHQTLDPRLTLTTKLEHNIQRRGGSRNLFWGRPNQGPQSKVEGEARIEGAKRPRIEGEARTEGEAREKAGGGVWGGGSVSPSPENF